MENLTSLLKFWVWESGRKIDLATGVTQPVEGNWTWPHYQSARPNQTCMFTFKKLEIKENVLFIIQYKYLKSFSGDFYSPESDPPQKIIRYWIYYSIWLGFSFQNQFEMFCIEGVPVSKRHFGGAGPWIFYMIHRGGRIFTCVSWTELRAGAVS